MAVTQPKQSSHAVWHDFINKTGWDSNGLVFLLGLINPIYGFGGLDGAIHLGEDCFEPAKAVPRAIVNSLVVGFITTFFFSPSQCCTVLGIWKLHLKAAQGRFLSPYSRSKLLSKEFGRVPIYEVWFQATGSGAAATVFMAMMLLALFITSIGSVQSGSLLTWSFARDDAIFLSAYVKRTQNRLGVPGWTILFNGFWLSVLGCVHLVSSSGEHAIL